MDDQFPLMLEDVEAVEAAGKALWLTPAVEGCAGGMPWLAPAVEVGAVALWLPPA